MNYAKFYYRFERRRYGHKADISNTCSRCLGCILNKTKKSFYMFFLLEFDSSKDLIRSEMFIYLLQLKRSNAFYHTICLPIDIFNAAFLIISRESDFIDHLVNTWIKYIKCFDRFNYLGSKRPSF